MAFSRSARLTSGKAPRLAVNGRSLEPALNGVQRRGHEMTCAPADTWLKAHNPLMMPRPTHVPTRPHPACVAGAYDG